VQRRDHAIGPQHRAAAADTDRVDRLAAAHGLGEVRDRREEQIRIDIVRCGYASDAARRTVRVDYRSAAPGAADIDREDRRIDLA
jgi:hypothetical protein